MTDEDGNRLLMSDSLRGMVPELEEEQFQAFQDAFVIVAVLLNDGNQTLEATGNLVGLSMENRDLIKLDVRVSIEDAYRAVGRHISGELKCDAVQLLLASDGIRINGPRRVAALKMFDIDHNNKMCTLAIDLASP
jgi:hypothetical protein